MKSKNRGLIPLQPKRRQAVLASSIAALAVLCLAPRPALAQTWLLTPGSGDWDTAGNWNPASVPNGPGATATFGASNTLSLSLSATTEVGAITFTTSATSPYTITTANFFNISGTGISNTSGNTQSFVASPNGTIAFRNSATAGTLTDFSTMDSTNPAGPGGLLEFLDNSTAGSATITNNGATANGNIGGGTIFYDNSTAGSAGIITNGGDGGGNGGTLTFTNSSSAGFATLTTNGGTNGGSGGATFFKNSADGGRANAITNAGGTFDISGLNDGGMKIGSISGAGLYNLGGNTLTVGGNGLNTTVTGVIQDGGASGGTGGSLVVTGLGSLTLTGQNTYTGSTGIINGGTLNAIVAGALPAPVADGGNGTARDSLLMDQTGTGGSTLNLDGNQAVASLTGAASSIIHLVNGSTLTVGNSTTTSTTFAGTIADWTGSPGSGSLIKDGSSTQILSGNNLYTGQTTVNGGILQIGDGTTGNLTGTSGVTVNNGAELEINLGNGGVFGKSVALNVGASFVGGASGTNINTVSGILSGTGEFDQEGTGTTILTGAHTYSGATSVNAGTLQLGAGGKAGSIANTGNITVDPNGTLVVVNTGGAFANTVNVQGSTGLTGGTIIFSLNSTAGTANITNGGGTTDNAPGGSIDFSNNSTAGSATISNAGGAGNMAFGGFLDFSDNTTAGSAQITNNGGTTNSAFGASTSFFVNATAGNATITNNGATNGNALTGGATTFFGSSNAGNATITNNGGTVSGAPGSITTFEATSSAGTATLTANGATVNGGGGGQVYFSVSSSAGAATLNINGGTNGGAGGAVYFQGNADGGIATVNNNAGGTFDISGLTSAGMNIGPISGAGTFALGSKTLTVVAGNTNDTDVTGVIEDGGLAGGTGGSLTISSHANQVALSGQNTYTGTTSIINGATLFAEVTGALPAPAADGGTGTTRDALVMDLTGPGGSTLVIDANQAVASLTSAASSRIILNGNTLTVGAMLGASSIFGGVISDGSRSGGLTVDGNGVQYLFGNNTYTGQTTVNGSAILVVGNGSNGNLTGTSGVSVANGATLDVNLASGSVFSPNVQLNGSGASLLMVSVWTNTVSGAISGTGSIAQDSSGTTILTGANTYSGGTFVNGGTLQLGTAAVAASITNAVTVRDRGTLSLVNVAGGTFANNVSNDQGGVGTVNINSATTITLSGALADGNGQLALTKNGTGTAILSGINYTYTGATTVNGGILEVDGSLGHTVVTVNKNAALSGGGLVGQDVNIETGASLETVGAASPGVRTLGVGNLVLNTGANTIFRLGAPGTSDFVDAGGNLTLGGTLNVVPLAGFGAGTYSLFGFGIGVSKSFTVSAIPGFTTATTTVGNTVKLIVTQAAGTLAEQNWNSIGNGTSNGGSGTWNTTAVNWSDPSSNGTTNWLGGSADFGIAGGTVTIPASTTINAQGLLFDVDGYSINGTSPTTSALSLTQKATITVNTGTAILNTKVTGSAGLLANGPGTLVLANIANTISGKVSVVTGTLQIGTAANEGSIGPSATVTLSNGATLNVLNALNNSLPNAISAGLGQTGTVNIASVNNLTLSGALTDGAPGQLALTLSGTGTTTLTNSKNTFSGATTIGTGTLQIGTPTTPGSLGASSPVTFNDGGALALINVSGNFSNNVTIAAPVFASVIANSKNNFTVSGSLTDGDGTLKFFQQGIGTVILSGNNSFTSSGVSSGTLQVGDGTTGTTSISSSANQVQVLGTGTLATDLSSGSTFANAVMFNTTTSVFNAIQSGTNTLSGVISGSGSFNQKGTGRTILTATETYTGPTTITAGVLQVGDFDALFGNLAGTSGVTVSGTGGLALDLPPGQHFVPNVKLSAATNHLQAIAPGAMTMAGIISGLGVFDQNGLGFTVLTAAETYTGGTNVNAGVLEVQSGASLAPGTVHVNGGELIVRGSVAAGSTIIVAQPGTLAGTGTINANMTSSGTLDLNNGVIGGTLGLTGGTWSGNGTVDKAVTSSSGVFTLNGNMVVLAGLTVTGGTLAGTGTLIGSVNYTSTSNSTFGGVIADGTTASSLTMNKANSTLVLTGANTYTGATTLSAGFLNIGDGSTGSIAANSAVKITGGTLFLDQPTNASFANTVSLTSATAIFGASSAGVFVDLTGVISGTGSFKQSGSGSSILDANETYTGATNVNAGTLIINGSVAAGSTVNVTAPGILQGTGTIHGSVTSLGTLDFDGSIGGSVTMNGGAWNGTGSIGGTLRITGAAWNGTGTVAKAVTASSGVFTLSGNMTAPTGLTVTAGTLAGTGTLTGSLNYTSAASSTFAGVITDGTAKSKLTMNKAGSTLTLTGNSTYTGGTTVSAGTLQIGDGNSGSLGNTDITVSGTGVLATDLADGATFSQNVALSATGATLRAIQFGTNTLSGVISGLGGLNQAGSGTTILSPIETYTGPTNVNAGLLEVDGSLAAASTVHVGTMGTLSGVGTIRGNATLSGSGVINLNGGTIGGTLTVTGGTWLGGTVNGLVTSSSGTFTIGNNATLTALAGVNVTGGSFTAVDALATLAGSLNDTSSSSFAFGGVIADHGSPSSVTMNKAGATLTLLGANTYTGPTTVSAGTLQILSDSIVFNNTLAGTAITVSGTGVLATNLADGATFSHNVTLSGAGATFESIPSGTNTNTLSGTISGTGGLAQIGTGRTIVPNSQTYTGVTNVIAGVLQVDGGLAAGSTVNVSGAGALAGTGTVLGTVNIGTGGALSPGDVGGLGTLNVGKLVLGTGANSYFGVGGASDVVAVTGNLTVAGNVNVTQLTNFGVGTYRLFTYGGTLTNTGFTEINGIGGWAASISTATSGQVNLVVTGPATTQYWDGPVTVANSVVGGGSGPWNNTTTNWTNSGGTANARWSAGNAVFENVPGTVTIGAPFSAQNLTFSVSGYTLSGTIPLNLVGAVNAAPTIDVAGTSVAKATISAPLTGMAGLNANGDGTLILTNPANTYTGGTQVSSGILQIGTASAAGSLGSGTVSISNLGALNLLNVHGNILANNVTTGSGGNGLLLIGCTLATTLSGTLTDGASGQLNLLQDGTGTTTVTNAGNSFSGVTSIHEGTLQVGNTTVAGALGSGSVVSVGSGGTLSLVNVSGNVFGNSISNLIGGAGTVNVNSAGQNTISGVISDQSGTVALTQSGTGATILTGANTYSGKTTLNKGTLLANNTTGSATGTGAVTVNNGGTLGGDGNISGATTLNSGGTIEPGAGSLGIPGTTLHAASLLWNPGSTLTLQLGSAGADALVLTGALTKGTTGTGAYTINIADVGGIPTGDYTLATFASTTFSATNFTLELPGNYAGSLSITGGENLVLDVTAGSGEQPAHSEGTDLLTNTDAPTPSTDSGSSLGLTPTPEPGSAALLAFGGAALLGWRRKRV